MIETPICPNCGKEACISSIDGSPESRYAFCEYCEIDIELTKDQAEFLYDNAD